MASKPDFMPQLLREDDEEKLARRPILGFKKLQVC
jgi:hypothetical protein